MALRSRLERFLAADAKHGPLPPLLLTLTFVTGLVDAVSYLQLGHVFVANMTGNVVFLGFAVADAEDFSVPASLAAIVRVMGVPSPGGELGSPLIVPVGATLVTVTGSLETVTLAPSLSVTVQVAT